MKIDRRRLLKGSLAAPVVLTVRPASATATGSAVACLKRSEAAAKSDPPAPLAYGPNHDEYMRVTIDLSRLAPERGKAFYSGKYFLGFDKTTYWRVDDRRPYERAPKPTEYTKGSCHEEKTGERLYALAYVDKHGNVVAFGVDQNRNGSPVTTSCYASAAGLKLKT